MMTGLGTILRCSALPTAADCMRRFAAITWRRPIEDQLGIKLRRRPRTIGAIAGTSVHTGAEIPLTEKMKTGVLPPESVALDAAVWTLGKQLREAEEISYDGNGPTNNATQAEVQVIEMTRAYYRVIAPTVHPIQVEERLEAEIAPGLILSGKPDILAREPHRVRDLKTGIRDRGTHAPQVGGYSLLARSNGLDIQGASIDFVQRVRISKPQPDPVTKQLVVGQAETAASNIIKHIVRDLDTFQHGDPERRIAPGDPWSFVANPNSILCSPKYCPAFGTEFCREGDPAKELP
jgi:PD-(D/E)XK nuclease superfamily